jgi:hypothetical protein
MFRMDYVSGRQVWLYPTVKFHIYKRIKQ